MQKLLNLSINLNKIIIITGQTGCGKSRYALEIAKTIGGIIINSDAMQVYKEAPILSASPENFDGIEHKLYNIIDGNYDFSVKTWINMAVKEVENAFLNNLTPIIVGGSPMYNRILVDGINDVPDIPDNIKNLQITKEEAYQKLIIIDPLSRDIDKNNTNRVIRAYKVFLATGRSIYDFHRDSKVKFLEKYQLQKIIIKVSSENLKQNCQNRFKKMIERGAIEEVIKLYAKKYSSNMNIFKTIGVREIKQYLKSEISLEKAIDLSVMHTLQYAKKQATWFNNKFYDFENIIL